MSSKKTLMMTYGCWMGKVWLLANVATLNISRSPWKPPQRGRVLVVRTISGQSMLPTGETPSMMLLELDVVLVHGTAVTLRAALWTFRRERDK